MMIPKMHFPRELLNGKRMSRQINALNELIMIIKEQI
jgi:hypothetical protein